MNTAWKKHFDGDVQELIKQLAADRTSLELFVEILRGKLLGVSGRSDYDCPSWAYKQADKNGYNRALSEAIKILEDTK